LPHLSTESSNAGICSNRTTHLDEWDKQSQTIGPFHVEQLVPMSDTLNTTAQSRIRSFIERIERLKQIQREAADDMTEVYAEAKGEGFDVKILRKVVDRRALDPAARQEQEALLDLYETAVREGS